MKRNLILPLVAAVFSLALPNLSPADAKTKHNRPNSGWILTPKSNFHIKATTAYQVKKEAKPSARSTRTHMKKTTQWVSGEPIKEHSTQSTKSFHKHNYSAYLGTAKPKLNEGKPCYKHKSKSSEYGIEPHPGPKKCRTDHRRFQSDLKIKSQ